MKLSIIVPVYNVENYVFQCLESLVFSSNFRYEIIIINDGSTDKSYPIILEFANQYPNLNIEIINQSNKGLSASRNIGLGIAKGEFVFFIDSDDWIDSNNFLKIIDECNFDIDILVANFLVAKIGEDFKSIESKTFETAFVDTGEGVLKNYYLNKISSVVWRSIYRKDFLIQNNLFFCEGVFYEDVEWTPKVFYYAKSVKVLPINFYFYRIRDGSIMNSEYNSKRFEDSLVVADIILKFCQNVTDYGCKIIFEKLGAYLLSKSIALYPLSISSENRRNIESIILNSNTKNFRLLFIQKCINYFPNTMKFLLKLYFTK